jgi:hypothetical protein
MRRVVLEGTDISTHMYINLWYTQIGGQHAITTNFSGYYIDSYKVNKTDFDFSLKKLTASFFSQLSLLK